MRCCLGELSREPTSSGGFVLGKLSEQPLSTLQIIRDSNASSSFEANTAAQTAINCTRTGKSDLWIYDDGVTLSVGWGPPYESNVITGYIGNAYVYVSLYPDLFNDVFLVGFNGEQYTFARSEGWHKLTLDNELVYFDDEYVGQLDAQGSDSPPFFLAGARANEHIDGVFSMIVDGVDVFASARWPSEWTLANPNDSKSESQCFARGSFFTPAAPSWGPSIPMPTAVCLGKPSSTL